MLFDSFLFICWSYWTWVLGLRAWFAKLKESWLRSGFEGIVGGRVFEFVLGYLELNNRGWKSNLKHIKKNGFGFKIVLL